MASMTVPTASYERQIPAKLLVRLDNGEEFEATDDDLAKFGLIQQVAFVAQLRAFLNGALEPSAA